MGVQETKVGRGKGPGFGLIFITHVSLGNALIEHFNLYVAIFLIICHVIYESFSGKMETHRNLEGNERVLNPAALNQATLGF